MSRTRLVSKTLAMAGLLLTAFAGSAAADVCDLTVLGSACGPGVAYPTSGPHKNTSFSASGAIFEQIAPQPTGTGYIDSFVRLQHSPTEQGYNTNVRPVQFDEKTDLTYTHAITAAEVPVVNINGTNYRQFFLDINENNSTNGSLLSLDKLQVFLGPNGYLSNYNTTNSTLSGLTPVYNLDTGSDNWIELDYSLNNGGSGVGDMVAFIPDSLFANLDANPYVYLYSQFGAQVSGPTSLTSDAGFEEWWVKSPIAPPPPTPVPEPTVLLTLGSGLVLVSRRLRRYWPGGPGSAEV